MSIDVWPPQQSPEQRLRQLIQDAQTLLGVTITVKDQRGLLRAADGAPLFASHAIHEVAFCQLLREDRPEDRRQCRHDCNEQVPLRAQLDRSPFTTCCYRGAVEVIVPVFDAGLLCFVLHAGVFRDSEGEHHPCAPRFPAEIRDAYRRLPVLTDETGQRIARVLEALGRAILQETMLLRQQGEGADLRTLQLRRLIDARAHEKLTLAEAAEVLGVSPSRASHLVRELLGDSFQNLLLKERVARAQSLLRSSEMSLKEVADACGFSNEYYFSRQFRQLTGLPPGRYAAQHLAAQRAEAPQSACLWANAAPHSSGFD